MRQWSARPPEVANLLNPAFGGLVLYSAVKSYRPEATHGMPYPLAALVLPIVLHKSTRESLPRNTSTTLLAWIERHQDLLPNLAPRVRDVLPFTREAILFLTMRDVLQSGAGGLLDLGRGPVGAVSQVIRESEEVRACLNRAQFVGRWLARAGEPATIYQALGIQP